MPQQERLFLLDGMALAYRAYFAFIQHPLINSKGMNTSAIYGFVTSLMRILEDEKPDHIAVVFDTKEPTFRHKMSSDYARLDLVFLKHAPTQHPTTAAPATLTISAIVRRTESRFVQESARQLAERLESGERKQSTVIQCVEPCLFPRYVLH